MDRRQSLIYPIIFLGALGKSDGAIAQVLSDGTMAMPTSVLTLGSNSTITGGTAVNNNLFHSFSQFSILPGSLATFNSAPNIEVIFARVTGNNPSSIQGGIVVPGATDLFLLNPAGVEFSNGATLSLGGSLFVTTAERLDFAGGGSFSAAAGALNDPLLNVNVPSGLQWGAQAAGLSLSNLAGTYGGGQDFHLLGGPVTLDNIQLAFGSRNFSAGAVGPNSRVGLVSSNSTAQLESLSADYSAVTAFEDITLSNGTELDTSSAAIPGSIRLQGRQVNLLDGGRLSTETSGSSASGDIEINASESFLAQGGRSNGSHSLTVGTLAGSTGSGGRLLINAPSVTLADGVLVYADTLSSGNGGVIEVNASDLLEIRGELPGNSNQVSLLAAITEAPATGDGGTLDLNVGTLRLLDGGSIDARNVLNGDGALINVNATNLIEIRGSNSDGGSVSQIYGYGSTGSSGAGATINLTTNQLSLLDGGIIDISPRGAGRGGELNINAQDILIQGTGPTMGSGIMALVDSGQGGNGGDINITTAGLNLLDGGAILMGADQAVTGGNLSIQATDLLVDGSGQAGNGQTSTSRILNQATLGTSGAVVINATDLDVTGGGIIASYLQGTGTAGPLSITGDRITIAGDNQSFSRIEAPDLSGSGGNNGDLTITANQSLSLVDGGRILSQVSGSTTAGTLSISAGDLQVRGQGQINSQIATLATNGAQGSNININAPSLTLDDGGQIVSQATNGGRGGDIGITSNALNILNTTGDPNRLSEILVQGNGGQAGNATITTDALQVTQSSRIRLLGDNGSTGSNLTVAANTLALDGGVIQSQMNAATGGNIDLAIANGIAIDNGAEIKTELANGANGGNLTITTTGDITASGNSDIYTSVNGAQGGNVAVTANALVDLEVRAALTPENDLVSGGNLSLVLTAPPPVDPPIEPPVDPPIEPPANPPVEPPVEPPVVPPVEPPIVPSVESPPPILPAFPNGLSPAALAQLAAATLAQSQEESSGNSDEVAAALRNSAAIQDAELAPGCIAGPDNRFVRTGKGGLPDNPSHVRSSVPLWQDGAAAQGRLAQVQPESPQAEWSAASALPEAAPPLAEAQGWTMNDSGQVQLLAEAPLPVKAAGCGLS